MKFSIIFGLLVVFFVCSCAQQTSKGVMKMETEPDQHLGTNGGLLFEKGGKRGSGYIDSLGTDYSLRYIPIFITNDSTIPIHIQIAFLKEYDYSVAYGNVKFKVIPLPKEWAQDGITDNMYDKLPSYIDKPIINEIIKPGEKVTIGIGTLVIKPRDISININAPFAHTEAGIFPACDWKMNVDPSSGPKIALGLKLVINEICTIIPCGHISYPTN